VQKVDEDKMAKFHFLKIARFLEKKVQALRQDRDMCMQEALNYSKMPSFNKAVEMARKSRKRWAAYEVMSGKHY